MLQCSTVYCKALTLALDIIKNVTSATVVEPYLFLKTVCLCLCDKYSVSSFFVFFFHSWNWSEPWMFLPAENLIQSRPNRSLSFCLPLQVTEETSGILQNLGYMCSCRGIINVKGKGELKTYFVHTEMTRSLSQGNVMPWDSTLDLHRAKAQTLI